jgi:hypothetical protein
MPRVTNAIRKNEIKKYCRKCGEKTYLDDFYINREWKAEHFRDAWCKKCVNNYVCDEETLKEYCEFNKRVFREELCVWVDEKLKIDFENDKKYVRCVDFNKKDRIFWDAFKKLFFQHMNRIQHYKFSGTLTEDEIIELKEDRKDNPDANRGLELDYGKKTYSAEWHGFYSVGELNYLNKYFNGLQRDFKLENSAYIDYAKKVCKASLAMDKAFSDMCDGKMGADKRYKDFKDIFDQLSQSAKFAEKTRTENDSVGFGSLGEVIKRMETTGFLQRKIEFEKDEIDRVIDDYRWIVTAVGEEI